MADVIVVTGSGSIGQSVARRIGPGKIVLLADLDGAKAESVAQTMRDAGFDVRPTTVDVTDPGAVDELVQEAVRPGDISGVIHAAGVPPSPAPPKLILRVDLCESRPRLFAGPGVERG